MASPNQILVLEVLEKKPKLYGLEIAQYSEGKLTARSIHTVLARLEESGLVRSAQEPKSTIHPGMRRPRYRLTVHGARVLKDWRTKQVANESRTNSSQ